MTPNLLTPSLQLSGRTTVRKRRELPTTGRVLVGVGDRVQSDTVVAEAEREGELRIVRVAEVLGVAPKEACERIIAQPGSQVKTGDVIAELSGLWGLFKTRVQAPITGKVEFVSEATGHLGIRAPAETITVKAYINGVVERVEPGHGVIVVAEATLVQGIFGVGGERTGIITMLPVGAGQRVEVEHIPKQCSGAILIGGHSPTIGALNVAAERGAVGFITASIDDRTLAQYVGYDIGIALTGDEPVSMTLIITEGFGSLAMNERVVSILKLAEGAQASINGATQVRAGAERPEIITKATQEDSQHGLAGAAEVISGLQIGSRVRIVRVPYFGVQGQIVALPKELRQIETGAFARVAQVCLEPEGREVTVPRANIELVS